MKYEILEQGHNMVCVVYTFDDGTEVAVNLAVSPVFIGVDRENNQSLYHDPLHDLDGYIKSHGEAHWRGMLQQKWQDTRLHDAVAGLMGTTATLTPMHHEHRQHGAR